MAELLVEIGLNLSFQFQKVEEVMSENVGSTEPCSSLPKMTSVARAANCHRSKNRPKHPTTLDFELLDDHVPSQFLCGDVHKNGTCHLIFATDAQLEFLTNAKTWYVDATFKVIKQSFTQLFSIHAFVKKDGESMQTPLAFIVMSRRRRKDYKRVFHALIAALPRRPRVQAVVSDFEAFGETSKQSVYSARKRPTSMSTVCVVKRWHCHFYLQTSLPTRSRPCILRPTTHGLHSICGTWSSTTWPPTTWSVFRQPVRTNNDVEGWHCLLNDEASHSQFNLCKLIQLLYAEAALVQLNVCLLSEGHAMRLQRKSFAALHSRLSKYWDEYVASTRSAHGSSSAACMFAPLQEHVGYVLAYCCHNF